MFYQNLTIESKGYWDSASEHQLKQKTTKNKKFKKTCYSSEGGTREPRHKGRVIQAFLNLKILQEERVWPLVSYASHHTKRQFQNLNLQRWGKKKKNNGNSKCISGHIPKGSLKVFLIHRLVCFRYNSSCYYIQTKKNDPLFAKIFKYLTFSPKFYYGIDFCSVGVFFLF